MSSYEPAAIGLGQQSYIKKKSSDDIQYVTVDIHFFIKKSFSFFTLTLTLTTSPHHFPSRPLFFRQECILLVTGIQWASRKQRYTGRIAMLHYRCKYAAHLVPDGCTFLAPFFCDVLPMLDYRYTYAVLSVYLCWTFGTRMLYSSGTVFSICLQAISRRIKSSFFVLLQQDLSMRV